MNLILNLIINSDIKDSFIKSMLTFIFVILAEWIEIGGKSYDFNPAGLTQSEARARCIRFGGKLFEPKDAKTNKDVFLKAGKG